MPWSLEWLRTSSPCILRIIHRMLRLLVEYPLHLGYMGLAQHTTRRVLRPLLLCMQRCEVYNTVIVMWQLLLVSV